MPMLDYEEELRSVTSSVAQTGGVNPDEHAEILGISETTGLPAPVVERNKQKIQEKQQLDSATIQAIFNGEPAAREWFKDADNAKLVSDDFSILGTTKRYLSEFPEAFSSGMDGLKANDLAFRQTFGKLSPQEEAELNALNRSLEGKDFTGGSAFRQFTVGAANTAPQVIDQFAAGVGGGLAGGVGAGGASAGAAAIAGQLGPQVAVPEEILTVPAAFAFGFRQGFKPGATAGVLLENFTQQSGQITRDLQGIKGINGEALDPNVIRGAAFLAGGANAGLDLLPFDKLLKTVPGIDKVGNYLSRDGIRKAVRLPGVQQRLYQIGKSLATVGLVEGGVEGIQQAVQIASTEAAKELSDGEFTPITIKEAAGQIVEAGQAGFFIGLGLGTPGSVTGIPGAVRKREYTPDQVKAHVENITQNVRESRLFQRSPTRFHDLVKQLSGDDKFYVGSEAAEQFLASAPPDIQAKIYAAVPDLKPQLDAAVTTGAEVSISKADYATFIAPLEGSEALSDHIKLDPADMSFAERTAYQEFIQKNPQVIQEAVGASKSVPQEFYGAIERVVKQSLVGAGRTSQEAATVAPLFARAISRFAAPLGLDPTEEFNRGLVAFETVNEQGQPLQTGSNYDVLINDLDRIQRGERVKLDDAGRAAVESFGKRLETAGITVEQAREMGGQQVFEQLYPSEQSVQEIPQEREILRQKYEPVKFAAPNGQPSNLSPRLWAVVRSPEFKAWFGDWENDPANASKVVDENGEPKVVYHGTGTTIEAFSYEFTGQGNDQLGSGFYFTDDRAQAEQYKEKTLPDGTPKLGGTDNPNVVEAFLNIRNPLDASAVGQVTSEQIRQMLEFAPPEALQEGLSNWGDVDFEGVSAVLNNALSSYEIDGENIVRGLFSLANDLFGANPEGVQAFNTAVRDVLGFDGVTAQYEGFNHYVAFFPEQVKSTDNEGAFDPNDAQILKQAAFHGSPYKFDKFTLSHIGKGEGNQSYGWGLYFSGKKQIAETYRQALAGEERVYTIDGNPVDISKLPALESLAVKIASQPELYSIQAAEDAGASPDAVQKLTALVSGFNGRVSYSEVPRGQVYQVNIPEDKDMLSWELPLAKQPEAIAFVLKDYGFKENWAGADFYRHIERMAAQGEGEVGKLRYERGITPAQAASEFLNSLGVKGIRYPADMHRGKRGEEGYNYVVFDERAIDILETYYQQERGYVTLSRDFEGKVRRAVVTFTRTANFSTAAHEFSHWAVAMHREFVQIARQRDQRDPDVRRIVDDWEELKRQVGAEGDSFTVEQEEKIARQFEAYLREGNAPSEGLRRVFARFRDWLVQIYRDLSGLGVELNDEMRGVFNRWLASTEEIDAVRGKNDALSETARSLGLPENITQQVSDYVNSAMTIAQEKLYRELSAEQKRRETDAYKREFEKARKVVAAEYRQKRDYSLVEYLDREGFRLFVDPSVPADQLGLPPQGYEGIDYDSATEVSPGELDRLIEEEADAKAIRESIINILLSPSPKKPRSLTAFLVSRGGITDRARRSTQGFYGVQSELGASLGELDAMGITSKTRPGLVNNKSGLELDYAREAAVEAGYLPEDADINAFLDALREDFNGNPVYSNQDADSTSMLDQYAKAAEVADRLGIDIAFERKRRARFGRYADLFTDDKGSVNAVAPDSVAELFGYESGKELIKALRKLPDFDRVVSRETRLRLMEKYPDMVSQGRIQQKAVDAILNDKVVLSLDLMIKELGKQFGSRAGMKQFAKVMAQQHLSTMKASESGYAFRYDVARDKEIRLALMASRAGNPQESLLHLQKAMMNQAIFKSLQEFNELKDKAESLFKDVDDKDKNIAKTKDIDFIGAARYVLKKYGLGGSNFDINAWMADIRARKLDDVLLDLTHLVGILDAPQKTPKELTIPEYLDIYNTVKNIVETARKMREFEVADKKVKTEQAVGELVAALSKWKQTPQIEGTQVYGLAKIRKVTMGLKAMQRRVEHWVESVQDGYAGPFRNYIFQPVSDAAAAYRDARHDWMERLNAVLTKHKEHLTQPGKITVPEINRNFRDRLELIGFMLHTGNASNLDKLLGGYKITPESWQAALSRMIGDGTITKADYEAIQDLWDLAEDLKPISQKAHKELYGFRFEEIEVTPLATPFGVYRGGYWPATVDYDQVTEKLSDQQLDDLKRYSLASTNKGFTKNRNAAYRRPLSTDLRIASMHINQVLKFAYLEPAVRQVSRIVNNRDFMEALSAVDSEAKISMLDPWLKRSAWQTVSALATDNTAAQRFLNGPVFRFFNKTVSRNAMIGNVVNAMQNYTSAPIAMHKVGVRRFGKAFAQYLMNPLTTSQEIHKLSAYMRGRQNVNDILVAQEINRVVLRGNYYRKVTEFADRYGYIFQRISQNHVDNTTWLAGYNQALEKGDSEADAVKYADSVVRQTMGSMNPEDISDVEAGSEASKMFLKFYSWFNNLANYNSTAATRIIREFGWAGTPKLFWLYLMAVASPALLGELVVNVMRGEVPDDDDDDGEVLDDWLAWAVNSQARFAVAAVPFAGAPIGSYLLTTKDDKAFNDRITASPFFGQLDSTGRFFARDYQDESSEIRDGMRAIGFLTGLPLAQAAKPVSFLVDVEEGDSRPQNVLEFSRGLVAGPSSR